MKPLANILDFAMQEVSKCLVHRYAGILISNRIFFMDLHTSISCWQQLFQSETNYFLPFTLLSNGLCYIKQYQRVAGVCKQTNNNFKEYSVCVIHILSCRRAILCITQMLYFIALNLGIGIGIHLLRSAF